MEELVFKSRHLGSKKKSQFISTQRVVQMFVETERADHEAEGNIIRVQNDALRKTTEKNTENLSI